MLPGSAMSGRRWAGKPAVSSLQNKSEAYSSRLGLVAFTCSWKLSATAHTQQKGGQNAVLSENVSADFKAMSLDFIDSGQKVENHHDMGLGDNQWGTTAAIRKG